MSGLVAKSLEILRRVIGEGSFRQKMKTCPEGIAIHGLQRHGTNYLSQCLLHLRVAQVNGVDPERNHPSHKHFRWYENKAAIPDVIRHQYGNTETAKSIFELNQLSGFYPETKHIVIFKSRIEGIKSILNWGLRCDWFQDKGHAISYAKDFVDDYNEFFNFWWGMHSRYPESVQVIYYDNLAEDIASLVEKLEILGISPPNLTGKLEIEQVPQSPAGRCHLISQDDLAGIISDQ